MSWIKITVSFIFWGFCLQATSAQEVKDVFGSIRLSAGPETSLYAAHVDSWKAGYGGRLVAATPFYVGDVELGISIVPWNAKDASVPNFMSALIFAGWSISSSPKNAVKAATGVRFGNYFMAFDSQEVSGERNESEFVVSPFIGLRRTFFRKIEGFIEVNASKVFTVPRIDFVQVSAGLSVTVGAPGWLRGILK